jgi:hypothetical protein
VGPQLVTTWIETSGRTIEHEIEAVLNRNRPSDSLFKINTENFIGPIAPTTKEQ